MSGLVDVKATWKVQARPAAARKERFHCVPVFDKLYLRDGVKQVQPPGFIRNKSDTDHWFLCISQLLCPPQADGYNFTAVNRPRPGFTCHDRASATLTFFFLILFLPCC